jgi:heme exporter protein B
MRFLRQTLAIAAKDLRSEIRGKEAVNASVSFALVILLLFSFAFDLEPAVIREIAGGLLWLIFAFAGTLILNRSFARELVNDCLDALLGFARQRRAVILWKVPGQLCADRDCGRHQPAVFRYLL